ncbi:MAG: 3-phosphoshikimate 1-carboxyvinyltransferase [Clostridia bacterium]|nr:3-phosphoshikimate 1-carboxyvinyltransferase [Clostridia bacterium]
MQATINGTNLIGKIDAPPSKSYAHRILISAYLSGEKVKVLNVGNSNDVLATLGALKSIGAEVFFDGVNATIMRKELPLTATVDCNESGSTLRFLFPVVSALGINATFIGKGKLLSRPIGELVKTLNSNGAKIDGYTVNGKLTSGDYKISASVSSQYVTGLMLALPMLDGDSKIIFEGVPVSLGYLDITLDVLKIFGVQIEKTDYGYYVKGNQKYKVTDTVIVEGDYSGSAFTLCSGAINGNVTVKGLNINSKQGDSEIINVLKKFGACVTVTGDEVTVKRKTLNAVDIDCENIPDLVQIMAVVGAFAKGTTILRNVERLKLKESDRINAIIDQLNKSQIKCEYKDKNLYVYGGEPKPSNFSGGKDHRTVMSATVLSLGTKGQSTVSEIEYANKSYVEFFNDVKKLGGDVNVNI